VRSNSPTERLKSHVWPALKKGISASLAESTKISRKRQDSQPSNVALPSVTFEPKQLKKAASGSLTERREIALAELGMMPMQACQGPRMDSREYTLNLKNKLDMLTLSSYYPWKDSRSREVK
jgi:hypothetical protein